MRFPLFLGIALLLFNAFIDYRVYRAILNVYGSRRWARVQFVSAVFFALCLVLLICLPKRGGSDNELVWLMWSLYAYITVYVPKYIFLIFNFFAGLPRLFGGRVFKPLSIAGIAMGVVVFFALWWGSLVTRVGIQVNEADVPVDGLPEVFDGLRIAQISDLHVGTFGHDTTFVAKLVDSINALQPDVIVFTGDIVNRRSVEFKPFMSAMSRLNAPLGVYSVMGNHDYGDYSDWPSEQAHRQDALDLKAMEAAAGLHMLNNEHVWLHAAGDSIALIGVENIGDPPFTVYGSLSDAYPDVSDPNTKILLTHNPAHWEKDIEDSPSNIALTLSGHTHAMQIELFGWSPASVRYDKWGGMYTDSKGQHLYVNIGAGTVGMPYRIGATPEISVFTLRNNPTSK